MKKKNIQAILQQSHWTIFDPVHIIVRQYSQLRIYPIIACATYQNASDEILHFPASSFLKKEQNKTHICQGFFSYQKQHQIVAMPGAKSHIGLWSTPQGRLEMPKWEWPKLKIAALQSQNVTSPHWNPSVATARKTFWSLSSQICSLRIWHQLFLMWV